MSVEERKEIYKKIFEKNGPEYQAAICIEECAELTKELTKYIRGKANRMKVAEEIADVILCVYSLINYFEFEEDVKLFFDFKMQRLKHFYVEGDEK